MLKLNRLEEILGERKIYNRRIAESLHVSEETVSRWKKNKQQPDLNTLNELAKFLEIDIRDLLHPSEHKINQ